MIMESDNNPRDPPRQAKCRPTKEVKYLITIRVTERERDRLHDIAREKGMSLNNYILTRLRIRE